MSGVWVVVVKTVSFMTLALFQRAVSSIRTKSREETSSPLSLDDSTSIHNPFMGSEVAQYRCVDEFLLEIMDAGM